MVPRIVYRRTRPLWFAAAGAAAWANRDGLRRWLQALGHGRVSQRRPA